MRFSNRSFSRKAGIRRREFVVIGVVDGASGFVGGTVVGTCAEGASESQDIPVVTGSPVSMVFFAMEPVDLSGLTLRVTCTP